MIVFCVIGKVHGQSERKHYFGAHYLLGYHNYNSSSVKLGSSKEYEGTSYYGLGLDYRYRFSENTELCLGISATINKMVLTSSQIGGSTSYYDDALPIFSLPVHFRHYFSNYFFIGGGPCLNIHQSMGYKGGIGIEINAGVEYVFKSGLTVSVSPRVQWNLLSVFGNEDPFNANMDILSQMGVNIGLGYSF